jgi:hypothetical protein
MASSSGGKNGSKNGNKIRRDSAASKSGDVTKGSDVTKGNNDVARGVGAMGSVASGILDNALFSPWRLAFGVGGSDATAGGGAMGHGSSGEDSQGSGSSTSSPIRGRAARGSSGGREDLRSSPSVSVARVTGKRKQALKTVLG